MNVEYVLEYTQTTPAYISGLDLYTPDIRQTSAFFTPSRKDFEAEECARTNSDITVGGWGEGLKGTGKRAKEEIRGEKRPQEAEDRGGFGGKDQRKEGKGQGQGIFEKEEEVCQAQAHLSQPCTIPKSSYTSHSESTDSFLTLSPKATTRTSFTPSFPSILQSIEPQPTSINSTSEEHYPSEVEALLAPGTLPSPDGSLDLLSIIQSKNTFCDFLCCNDSDGFFGFDLQHRRTSPPCQSAAVPDDLPDNAQGNAFAAVPIKGDEEEELRSVSSTTTSTAAHCRGANIDFYHIDPPGSHPHTFSWSRGYDPSTGALHSSISTDPFHNITEGSETCVCAIPGVGSARSISSEDFLSKHAGSLKLKLTEFRQYLRRHHACLSPSDIDLLKKERRRHLNRSYQRKARLQKRDAVQVMQAQVSTAMEQQRTRFIDLVWSHFAVHVNANIILAFEAALQHQENTMASNELEARGSAKDAMDNEEGEEEEEEEEVDDRAMG